MKLKFTMLAISMKILSLGTFAQIPLVYNVENTGSACTPAPLPAFSQLPTVDLLTDPFLKSDGSGRSTSFSSWQCRRNEIKREIENYEIGTKPPRPQNITASYANGVLTVNITVNGQSMTLTAQVTVPSGTGPFPAVIGMNSGTGSIPASIFTSRSIATIRYNHDQVTTYNNPQLTNPFYRLYPDQNLDNAGQYSAWAWGVSRIIDGLELVQSSLPVNLSRIAVTGCSYAGKMALFAGAFDERVALTIAQESGGGGAPAWRVSETIGDVEKLGATSRQWFRESMFQFAGTNVSKLPHDHHELMAMVAPRALLVTGNTDFTWLANPSCYVSARAAHEVWKTFGIGDRFGFYIDGGHGHCAVPSAQIPAIEAFVEKFLRGNTSANTNITTNPYPTVDHLRWYQWWAGGSSSSDTWLEAECGTVGADWNKVSDGTASGGSYVSVKNGLNSTAAPPTGAGSTVVLPFSVTTAATYDIQARVNCATANDDSYWVKIDNGSFVMVNNITTSGWQWKKLTSSALPVGQHNLTIAYREDGAKLDKVRISTSTTLPTDAGSPATNCGQAAVTAGGRNANGVIVAGSAMDNNDIKVFPNPTYGNITINLGTNQKNIRKIEVVDLSGRVIMQLNVTGKSVLTIHGAGLKAGTYFLRMQGDKVMNQKIVIQ